MPRSGAAARRADGRLGEGSREQAGLRQQREESRAQRHPEDLLAAHARTPRQTYDTCAYCHGNKQNIFLGFRGGDRYEDYALPFLISTPIPDNDFQGEFWPDGRPNRFNRPQALTLSGCFKAGQAVCTSCHVAHGSRNPFSLKVNITQGRTGDLLCVQCHAAGASAVRQVRQVLQVRKVRQAPPERGCRNRRVPGSDRAMVERGDRAAHVPQGRVGRQPLHQLSHERRELATADPPARSHVPAAGAGDDRGLRRAERLHDLSRRALAGVGGAPDGAVVGRRRPAQGGGRPGGHDVSRRFGRRERPAVAGPAGGRSDAGHAGACKRRRVHGADRARHRRRRQRGHAEPDVVRARVSGRRQRSPAKPGNAHAGADQRAHRRGLRSGADRPRPGGQRAARHRRSRPRGHAASSRGSWIQRASCARARRKRCCRSASSTLPGRAGEVLARAQDDFAAALRDFPDSASNHAALGWLDSERGRSADAAGGARSRHQPGSARRTAAG